MASSAQTRANRRNAKKSTGPKTARGRSSSSKNSTRHGITGKAKDCDIYREAASLGLGGDADDHQSLKLAAAQLRINQIHAERDRSYLSLYDWLFGDELSHFEARLLRDISETIEDFKVEPGYLFSREHFRDEAFRLKMATRMSTLAFLKMLRLSDRYLDEAQSKRRAAIKSLISTGQFSATSLMKGCMFRKVFIALEDTQFRRM